MACGRLMHYNYYPIIVTLDEEEMDSYVAHVANYKDTIETLKMCVATFNRS